MRSDLTKKILANASEDSKIFVEWYADIVMRIDEIMCDLNITQKNLAEKMDKKPSEISKWLKGNHNFTLKSLAKLQAELGYPILEIVQRKQHPVVKGKICNMVVIKTANDIDATYSTYNKPQQKSKELLANVG